MPLLAPLQRSRLDLFDGHSGKRDAFPEERDIRGQMIQEIRMTYFREL